MRRTATCVLLACLPALACPARGDINLELRADESTVEVGETVYLGLYATSTTSDSMASADVVLIWPTANFDFLGNDNTGAVPLLLSGFPSPDGHGLNDDTNDGDALYVAFAPLGSPVVATPAGTLLTTFAFQATAVGNATVDMPREHSSGARTRVFDGTVPNLDVTGDLIPATIEIVPEGALCRADFDHNGQVDVFDLFQLLSAWGMCGRGCLGDLDHNDFVDVFDLFELLAAWGPCP